MVSAAALAKRSAIKSSAEGEINSDTTTSWKTWTNHSVLALNNHAVEKRHKTTKISFHKKQYISSWGWLFFNFCKLPASIVLNWF